MSIPYERTGRTRQKARTRRALVAAARELLAQGVTPTVEEAADAADMARTTAYRYFPNQRALLVATFPQIAASSLLPADAPHDPEEHSSGGVIAGGHSELPFRTGRAISWIEEALAPLRGRLPEPQLHRLTLAIRSAVGIESLVWLTDVAGISREEAVELMRWAAHALLRTALEELVTEHATDVG